ncbi:MAG: hypothetical protein HN350_06755 [Phycisphaerales bacterium]|jgi:hypothetical protein|nr:hypothetical protein [Phycisphaerales bacterium]
MKSIALGTLLCLTAIAFSVSATDKKKPLQPADIEYLGAFRLPAGGTQDAQTWNYAGSAMTFYPKGDSEGANDGFPGSILGTGHEQHQHVSEFSIPKPVISKTKNVKDLNRAKCLQKFTDIRDASFKEYEMPRVGLAYLEKHSRQDSDYLFYTWAQHLDETATGPSLGAHKLKLADTKSWGPWKIDGKSNYLTADLLFTIPAKWAEKNSSGMRLAMGRYRDGGQSSQGPTIIVCDPAANGALPKKGASIKNKTLLRYSNIMDDPKASKGMKGYTHADAWNGAVWADSKGKQAMIFTGIKGEGKCWYGYGDGTVWPEEPPYPPEPAGGRGWWATKFTPMFIFYNPDDLAKVASGKMKPHQPQPYAKMDISKHLFNIPKNRIWMMLGATCIDNKNGLIYMFEHNGDAENSESIVHVWKIK